MTTYTTIHDDLRTRLRELVAELGEAQASRTLGLSRLAIARVLAGLRVYPGTAAVLETRLPLLALTAENSP